MVKVCGKSEDNRESDSGLPYTVCSHAWLKCVVRVKTAGKLTVVGHVLCAGLEVLAVCFDKQLASEWHHVAKCIQHLALKGKGHF